MILSDKHPSHFYRALSDIEKNLGSNQTSNGIKYVIESLEQMFLKWNFGINIHKSGIYFQRQLSKSVSSSPRSLSLICCLIKVEMLPFLAKKSQQSNHKMGNFSCYKKLRRSCIIAKLMVSNYNLFLSISLASKINNCLMSAPKIYKWLFKFCILI